MTPLHELIAHRIAADGPMSVHDYMQLCLMHPEHGYYQRQRVFGPAGDFTTAPEISQLFGDLLGFWCIDTWEKLGRPANWSLAELGPGQGTLMADMLRIIGKHNLPMPDIHLVETSHQLRTRQAERLAEYTPHRHDSVATLPDNLPLIAIANEFFDALPIRQWVGREERCVTVEEDALVFTPPGKVTREECPAATDIIAELAACLQSGGTCLFIDYGYATSPAGQSPSPLEGEGRGRRADGGGYNSCSVPSRSTPPPNLPPHGGEELNRDTLQAVRGHAYTSPLADPGLADITAHVDFAAIAESARRAGATVHGPITQAAFLQSLGGDLWLQKLARTTTPEQRETLQSGWLRLISPNQMGHLFKAMALSSPAIPTLAGF